MKRFITLIFLVALAATAFSQRVGIVVTQDTVTVDDVETRYTDPVILKGHYNSVAMQALCTQLGGTSDGKIIAQGSVDGTSYVNLNEGTDYVYFFPDNDTLTITNGAIMSVTIKNPPFAYFRFKVTGTASDTTQVTPKYIVK